MAVGVVVVVVLVDLYCASDAWEWTRQAPWYVPCARAVYVVLNPLQMGPHRPSTYKSMSPVPPFGDVGAHVQ